MQNVKVNDLDVEAWQRNIMPGSKETAEKWCHWHLSFWKRLQSPFHNVYGFGAPANHGMSHYPQTEKTLWTFQLSKLLEEHSDNSSRWWQKTPQQHLKGSLEVSVYNSKNSIQRLSFRIKIIADQEGSFFSNILMTPKTFEKIFWGLVR